MESPSLVQIETTNMCNARCDFCATQFNDNTRMVMSNELFEKIIDDCKQFSVNTICPFLNGEPFMDKNILDRLGYINKELPSTGLDIFSNMELVTQEKVEKLSHIKNINSFVMSVSGYDKESSYRHQRVDWDKVYNNIKYLVNKNLTNRFIKNLQLVAMTYNEEEKILCSKIWKTFKGIDNFFFTVKQNWLGYIKSDLNISLDYICPRTSHITICVDGRVSLCCFDGLCEYPIGNVNENSILEIYNSEVYKKYRTHKKRDLIPCNRCTV
jgi:MoaA/NifB/PqqE/SkfB family radical SAM enzyme